MKKYNTEEYIKKVIKKYNFNYDYSNTIYINMDHPIKIKCNIHGIFKTSPRRHFYRGHGCPKCKAKSNRERCIKTTEQFIKDAINIHNKKYDYSEVIYTGAHNKVKIKCSKHGYFWQRPTNHLKKERGCPTCRGSVSRSSQVWLDSLEINIREYILYIDKNMYKVDGIDLDKNIIYEYFGVFWHAHPDYCDLDKVHPRIGLLNREIYNSTLKRVEIFKNAGYTVIYKWGP